MTIVDELPSTVVAAESNGASPGPAPGKQAKHLPGEEGTWIFILGDMTVFALLFGVFMYARAGDPELFRVSQQGLNQNYGVVNTLLLLASSLMVVTGIRAIRHDVRGVARPMFAGAFACGLGFAFMKYLEWGDKLSHDVTPSTNDFWMYYYVLTGLHFFHLLLGMGVLVFLYTQSRQPRLSARRFAFVEGGACFWHMVDLLWIVLFALLYLVK